MNTVITETHTERNKFSDMIFGPKVFQPTPVSLWRCFFIPCFLYVLSCTCRSGECQQWTETVNSLAASSTSCSRALSCSASTQTREKLQPKCH